MSKHAVVKSLLFLIFWSATVGTLAGEGLSWSGSHVYAPTGTSTTRTIYYSGWIDVTFEGFDRDYGDRGLDNFYASISLDTETNSGLFFSVSVFATSFDVKTRRATRGNGEHSDANITERLYKFRPVSAMPSLTLTPTPSSNWQSSPNYSISATAGDPGGTGLVSLTWSLSGPSGTSSGSAAAGSTTIPVTLTTEGTHTFTATLTDHLGLSTTTSTLLRYDKTPPVVTRVNQYDPALWYGPQSVAPIPNPVWTVGVSDAVAGLNTATTATYYKMGHSPIEVAVTADNFAATFPSAAVQALAAGGNAIGLPTPTDGYYYLLVVAADAAGNVTRTVSPAFRYDASPPATVASQASFTTTNQSIDGIQVEWSAAADSGSQVAAYQVVRFVPATGQTLAWGDSVTAGNATTFQTSFALTEADRGQSFLMAVVATDRAGNRSLLPDPLTGLMFSPLLTGVGVGEAVLDAEGNAAIELEFPLTPAEFRDRYDEVRLRRVPGSSSLPAAVTEAALEFDPQTVVTANGDLTDPTRWKLRTAPDGSTRLVYTDRIERSPGWGNRSLYYEVFDRPRGQSVEERASETAALRLPNHQGVLTFGVRDQNGTVYQEGDSAFTVGIDGQVQIVFQGEDLDQDPWLVEVDKVTQNAGLTIYQSLSGPTPLGYGQAGSYDEAVVPVTLVAGDNYVGLSWSEAGSDWLRTAVAIVHLEPVPFGEGYYLTITGTLGTASTGGTLEVRPGEPLTLTVSAAGDPVTWDFGDGTQAQGAAMVYRYHQHPAQTGAEWPTTLRVQVGASSLAVPVIVRDTQEGTLYESERWRGDHRLTGVVTVPAGLTLTAESMAATLTAGRRAGSDEPSGLVIQGQVNWGDGWVLTRAAGLATPWAGLVVDGGVLTLGASEIRGAAQAVTVGPQSQATLVGTRLAANQTGLHVFGPSVVSLDGCEIIDNTIYGIKEDGGRPRLTDTLLRGNWRPYYSWDEGLWTMARINAVAGNSGNLGE